MELLHAICKVMHYFDFSVGRRSPVLLHLKLRPLITLATPIGSPGFFEDGATLLHGFFWPALRIALGHTTKARNRPSSAAASKNVHFFRLYIY